MRSTLTILVIAFSSFSLCCTSLAQEFGPEPTPAPGFPSRSNDAPPQFEDEVSELPDIEANSTPTNRRPDNRFSAAFDDNSAFQQMVGDVKTTTLSVRTFRDVNNGHGQIKRVPMIQRRNVDPRNPKITPEEKLAVLIRVIEDELTQTRNKISKEKDEQKRAKLLKELERNYVFRFQADTAYQDFKVRQIEERANRLRAEVTKREQAQDDWAKAMVTLVRMKVSGIDVPGAPVTALTTPETPSDDIDDLFGAPDEVEPEYSRPVLRQNAPDEIFQFDLEADSDMPLDSDVPVDSDVLFDSQ